MVHKALADPDGSVRDIDDVLGGLSWVVADCVTRDSRIGYFAALYRQVTVAIQRAVERGEFDDGPRMQRFDAEFGKRYFRALGQWRAARVDGYPATWRDAFEASKKDDLAIVQHLVLGVNAHINVDLAVAAAAVADGAAIEDLRADFDHVNEILCSVLDRIQAVLNGFSPVMRLLDGLGWRLDEELLGFSVRTARGSAWSAAVLLAGLGAAERERVERLLDQEARTLGRLAMLGLPFRGPIPVRSAPLSNAEVIARLDRALP